MSGTNTLSVGEAVDQAVASLDFERIQKQYWEQNEFVFMSEFLPRPVVEECLLPCVQRLKPELNRNYVPGYKKGGSVSYYALREKAPEFMALYRSPSFVDFLCRLSSAALKPCPDNDPHSCALYYYTEPGDHIGFHYDTSYYKGARYTILMGLVDKSEHCRLVCQLYKDDPTRETEELSLCTQPGDMVIFNGDKLWHAVTPLRDGEERVALTMEYVTNQEMSRFKRIYSNLKDAFAYFGVKALLKGAS